MPWMETSPVEQRERFIRDHRLDLYAMAELCARYGISRKTGYKWLARFDEGGRRGPGRPQPGAASLPASDRAGRRRGDLCGAPAASELGAGEAPGLAAAAASGHRVAGRQHRGRSAGPPRAGQEAAPPAAASSIPASCRRDHRSAQRSLDRRLQGPLPHARRDLLLSADGRGSAHALPAGVSRAALDEGPGRPARLRAALSRVRAAARHSHRQRGALRHHRHPRPLAAQRLVAPAGHSASAHPARPPRAERRPRTDAQDPQGRGVSAAAVAASRPSSAPSTPSAVSTTTSGPTKCLGRAAARHAVPALSLASTPAGCPRSSTRATSSSSGSPTRARSASRSACSFSPTPSSSIRSASRRSTTGSGPFTSATSCSDASTNATTSSEPSRELSPMLPVYSVTYVPGCSTRAHSRHETGPKHSDRLSLSRQQPSPGILQ